MLDTVVQIIIFLFSLPTILWLFVYIGTKFLPSMINFITIIVCFIFRQQYLYVYSRTGGYEAQV